jgi:hypothetical protein
MEKQAGAGGSSTPPGPKDRELEGAARLGVPPRPGRERKQHRVHGLGPARIEGRRGPWPSAPRNR